MKPIDKQKYFELLNQAHLDPDSCGVFVSKKRHSGISEANMEYASLKIKNGESVSIITKKEDQSYIDKWVSFMNDKCQIEIGYNKIYGTVFTEDGIYQDKENFIGYEIFKK